MHGWTGPALIEIFTCAALLRCFSSESHPHIPATIRPHGESSVRSPTRARLGRAAHSLWSRIPRNPAALAGRLSAAAAKAASELAEAVGDVAESATSAVREMGDKLGSISTGKLQAKVIEASRRTRRLAAGTLFSFVAYIFLGALFFSFAEGWNYVDSIYFAVATASTQLPAPQNRRCLSYLASALRFFTSPHLTSPHLAHRYRRLR